MPKTKEQIEDELLALRAIKRDANALDQLLRRWQKRLWTYLWNLSRDEQAAWDLLQETCLSIASRIDRLRDPSALTRWIYRLAYRRYVDWVRTAQRKKRLQDELVVNCPRELPWGNDPRDRIYAALDDLAPEDRAAITLAYVDGFSYEEIGRMLGIPLGTVRSRIHNAKDKIRKAIGKDPP